MERFLTRCAEYIYKKHHGNLHEVCLVFPNRRAGTFFNSYLQEIIAEPAIGPMTTTVNELISGYSDLHQGEKLQMISILYPIFKKHTHTEETFDEFYFWGEVLLSDFNDIDRYLVSAKDLFTNIADLKDIGLGLDYLTPEQKEAIERFWGSLSAGMLNPHQKEFFSVWQMLYNIYYDFRNALLNRGMAFGGMIYREVTEHFKRNAPEFEFDNYYIIGLNAMNTCEKTFFRLLGPKAVFLWDYDKYYLDPKHEAGKFLRENLVMFPPPDDFHFDPTSFSGNKKIRMVAVSSSYGQAQEVPRFLNEIASDFRNEFDNTAIVLADESLLYPALGAIPPAVETINVTMGYPVKNSVVYGFLLLLINLIKNRRLNSEGQTVIYHRFVTDVLNHQLLGNVKHENSRKFISGLKKNNTVAVPVEEIDYSELHRLIFTVPDKVEDYNNYFLRVLEALFSMVKETDSDNKLLPELIFTLYQSVEKIGNTLAAIQPDQENMISPSVYFRLFGQYTGQASVAFEGEPLYGIQVMGILETRCLDFENLVILGLNEGKWPRTQSSPSFIPYNIRKGFGLPGIDEQDAMYAYYFYRLLQRARNVTATYSILKEGIGTGELSRFGYQLLYESGFDVKRTSLDFRFSSEPVSSVMVSGSKSKTEKLLQGNSFENPLSPTAINTWLQCTIKFYFRYILQLPEPEEMKDEIDSMAFGNIFHETIEQLYKPFRGKTVNKADLENILNDKVLVENEIRKAIGRNYLKQVAPGKPVPIEGKALLIFENIKTFIKRLIEVDMDLTPFHLIELEGKYVTSLDVVVNGQLHKIFIGGKIDRLDRVNGIIRALDYKTGNVENLVISEIADLFEKEKENNKKEILQALLYCMIYSESTGESSAVQPAIYSLRKLFGEKFTPDIKRYGEKLIYQDVKDEFRQELAGMLSEMLSESGSYTQTPHLKFCGYCAYRKVCLRY
jgi:CRISPR/Cas system-associated exonuclease Cas4 (RecB family)